MVKEHRFRYFIGNRIIDVLASSLSPKQIKEHTLFDHGYKYSVNVPSTPKRKTSLISKPLLPRIPYPNTNSTSAHIPATTPTSAHIPATIPVSVIFSKQEYKCLGCGKKLYEIYGQEPGILCVDCKNN